MQTAASKLEEAKWFDDECQQTVTCYLDDGEWTTVVVMACSSPGRCCKYYYMTEATRLLKHGNCVGEDTIAVKIYSDFTMQV